MSLVGNISVNNTDATDVRSGAPRPGTGRRPSTAAENVDHVGLHRIRSTQSNRRTSNDLPSTVAPSREDSEKPSFVDDISKSGKAYDDSTSSTDEEDERREKQIMGLARKMTQHSSHYGDADDVTFELPSRPSLLTSPTSSSADPATPNSGKSVRTIRSRRNSTRCTLQALQETGSSASTIVSRLLVPGPNKRLEISAIQSSLHFNDRIQYNH